VWCGMTRGEAVQNGAEQCGEERSGTVNNDGSIRRKENRG